MKKYAFPLSLGLVFLFQTMNSCNSPTNYAGNEEVEKKIKQVEENLVGPVQTQDQVKWTLKERMKLYKIPGLSIAVVHHYKIEWAERVWLGGFG